MSTVKRVYNDYNIETIDGLSNVNVTTHTLKLNGNLFVAGNMVSITSANLTVADPIITLNSGETGPGVTLIHSGVEIDRGTLPNVSIRWDEGVTAWQATEDGVTWKYLLQSNTGSSGLSSIADDPTPALGGNLNITNYQIYDTSANISINGNTVGTGGTGVYVRTQQKSASELITKNRALVYSLIL
jgi:hypothetical protein